MQTRLPLVLCFSLAAQANDFRPELGIESVGKTAYLIVPATKTPSVLFLWSGVRLEDLISSPNLLLTTEMPLSRDFRLQLDSQRQGFYYGIARPGAFIDDYS